MRSVKTGDRVKVLRFVSDSDSLGMTGRLGTVKNTDGLFVEVVLDNPVNDFGRAYGTDSRPAMLFDSEIEKIEPEPEYERLSVGDEFVVVSDPAIAPGSRGIVKYVLNNDYNGLGPFYGEIDGHQYALNFAKVKRVEPEQPEPKSEQSVSGFKVGDRVRLTGDLYGGVIGRVKSLPDHTGLWEVEDEQGNVVVPYTREMKHV